MEQRHIDGMGAIGAIRYEAVTQWLDQQGIDDSLERDRYRFFVAACDREYMAVIREEREREQKRTEAKLKQHHVGRR